MNKTLVAVICGLLLLALVACGQKEPATVTPTTPAGDVAVSDAEVDASATAIDKTAEVDTSGVDSLESDIDAINAANI